MMCCPAKMFASGQSALILVLIVSAVTRPSEGKPAKLFSPGQQQVVFVDEGGHVTHEEQGQLRQNFGSNFGNNNAAAGQDGASGPAQYEFAYDVKVPEEGNDYGHAERRNGDTTEGMYRVLLPDGRVQVVTYSVIGNSGFVATVTYQ
ncbi:pro-resilin-like isoform X1 [Hyalella azteca]|uniref:Pro-resilin-like isoform X1 n=1 Tax=Hyalella azteca TaxID=294128 RepID=A0A8B7P1B0_HYAAZ|nr:pro-resilin-like isoform X1 [Hyalella azteca]